MIWAIIMYITIYFGLYTSIFLFLTFLENKNYIKNPEAKKIYSVSVIVPAYNEAMGIARTIESLLKLDYPKNKLKIIVIDDGSKDNTYEIAKRYENKGVVIFTKKNSGKANSLNFVLKKIDTELIGCLDADSYVDSDALKKMIGYFNNKDVMVVTPSIKIGNAKNILQQIQRIEYLMGVYLRKVFSFLGSIHVTPGPFSIYRKDFLDKYGGWDESTLTEDIELALRIQSKNFILENSIDANVYTIGPKTFDGLFKQRMRWYVGFINNVIRYKSLFNIKYGNLGIFILPSSFIFVAFSILALFYSVYKLSINTFEWLVNFSAINFEFNPYLRTLTSSFNFYMQPFFILTLVMILFGAIGVVIAKKYSKELGNVGFFYVIYLLFYWLLFAFWWFIASVYKLFSVKMKWGGFNGKA